MRLEIRTIVEAISTFANSMDLVSERIAYGELPIISFKGLEYALSEIERTQKIGLQILLEYPSFIPNCEYIIQSLKKDTVFTEISLSYIERFDKVLKSIRATQPNTEE
jgi:hypothetical protein